MRRDEIYPGQRVHIEGVSGVHTVVAIEEQVILRSDDRERVAWPADLEPEIADVGEAPLPVEEQRVADAVSHLGAEAESPDGWKQKVSAKIEIEAEAAWAVEAARAVLARVLEWDLDLVESGATATLAAAMLGRLP